MIDRDIYLWESRRMPAGWLTRGSAAIAVMPRRPTKSGECGSFRHQPLKPFRRVSIPQRDLRRFYDECWWLQIFNGCYWNFCHSFADPSSTWNSCRAYASPTCSLCTGELSNPFDYLKEVQSIIWTPAFRLNAEHPTMQAFPVIHTFWCSDYERSLRFRPQRWENLSRLLMNDLLWVASIRTLSR